MEALNQRKRRIYIAARFKNVVWANEVAVHLRAAGHTVTSRWIEESSAAKHETLTDDERRVRADADITDLMRANTLVYLPTGGRHGGCHVEFGVALASGMDLFVFGARENVFHYLPGVKSCLTLRELIEELSY